MKKFTMIWVVLTVLVWITDAIKVRLDYCDPSRLVDFCFLFFLIPWLALTPFYLMLAFIHLGAMMFGGSAEGDKHED